MKICFWGDIAGALTGKTSGGGELQIALIAKALALNGYKVIVLDYTIEKEFITGEGIQVYPIEGWNKGIRKLRTFTHRLPGLYRSLKAQKADIYYCRIRNFRHILAYWAARNVDAKFILGVASDLDLMSFGSRWKYYYSSNLHKLFASLDGSLSEIVYPWLLRKSDVILVQHVGQKQLLLKKKIKSIVFPNLIDITQIPKISNAKKNDFIYVGWLDKRKGFAEFFKLVSSATTYTFKVIGPPRDKTGQYYYDKLKTFPNVILLGELNHKDTLEHIAYSKALISTSPMEGFPNIFIEAWACGIPVLSLCFDPGGVIKKENLGKVFNGQLDRLIDSLDSIKNTEEFSDRAKSYVQTYHVINGNKLTDLKTCFKSN